MDDATACYDWASPTLHTHTHVSVSSLCTAAKHGSPKILQPSPPFLEWWYDMVLHPYGHPPHIKHAKHLLYVWSRSGMSMKWMGGRNHILQHVPSEKPRQNPTAQPTPFIDGMVWCCDIMTASHGWRLLNTFYRYEVDLVWVWSGWEVLIISYSMSPVRNPLKILRLCPLLLEWWYGMVLWHYDCQPWLKAFKHFL